LGSTIGGSVIEGLETLRKICGEIIAKRELKVVVACICRLESGKKAIENELKLRQLSFKVEIYICDILNDNNRCFTEDSLFFDNDRIEIRQKKLHFNMVRELKKRVHLVMVEDNSL